SYKGRPCPPRNYRAPERTTKHDVPSVSLHLSWSPTSMEFADGPCLSFGLLKWISNVYGRVQHQKQPRRVPRRPRRHAPLCRAPQYHPRGRDIRDERTGHEEG